DEVTLIEGECTCPVGMDCKHVAATLFALMAQIAKPTAAAERAAVAFALFPELKPSRAPPPPRLEALDPDLVAWIDTLARLEQTESEDYPPDAHQRVIYVLNVESSAERVPRLIVTPVSARLLKDGRLSEQA